MTAAGGAVAVGAHGPDAAENRAFLAFSRTFRSLGLPVPKIYASDEESGVWLLEDLGDTTLFDLIKEARGTGSDLFPGSVLPLYRRVLDILPRFQVEGGKNIDFGQAYPRGVFDQQSMLWDLNYFKYHFLKLANVSFDEAKLERDFATLVRHLANAGTRHFLYRDLQSRNVMVRMGADGPEPWFIDYQGGRRGALQYDVASLLYDSKANLGDRERADLLDHYLAVLESDGISAREDFLELWPGYVLIRILQAFGAYGYRGFFERKPHFLLSVPYGADNIAGLLESGLSVDVPELERVLREIVDRWGRATEHAAAIAGLKLSISSFSFAEGYPPDEAGHGGGYIFDCRGLDNPGRKEGYRRLTGLDEATIEYLAARPEVEAYWERVRAIVDAHVAVYLERGFDSLTVDFGCTGGQHRSVYMAERLSRHVSLRHPSVRVTLVHRAAARWPGPPDREWRGRGTAAAE